MLALVTAAAAAPLDPDLEPLADALRHRLGAEAVTVVEWDDRTVDWAAFDAVVIRSTWDYTHRLAEFLDWVAAVDRVSQLVNGAEVVRWSTDKRYLADLEAAGVPPTVFVAPGDPMPVVDDVQVVKHVVKPTVGAGSSGARRCSPAEVADHVTALHRDGFTAMVQPYLDLLDERGETEHCFVADDSGTLAFSHAFRKGAILAGDEVEQEGDLFAKEQISARVPSVEEMELAERVIRSAAIAGSDDIMFARVDVAPFRDRDGRESFVVMEVELIEPSFYFWVDESSVDRFADSLLRWLGHVADPVGADR